MRISELSRVTEVPVPTLKYYLREGLLHPGTPTAPNQADYDDSHVHRLRLVRVLREVGEMSIAKVKQVLDAVDDECVPVHRMLGVAHRALAPSPDEPPASPDVVRAREDVDDLLAELGWKVTEDAPGRRVLADALVALRRLGRDVGADVFEPYARAADDIAAHELSRPPSATREEGVERVVVGTVVFGRALQALRWLAQEHHSAERYGRLR